MLHAWLLIVILMSAPAAQAGHTTIWSEHTEPSSIYPHGIDGALAAHLGEHGLTVQTRGFNGNNPGLTPQDLDSIDVLVWFGHHRHADIPAALAGAIATAVRDRGMGFVALHSSHFAKPFLALMERSAAWRAYVEQAGPERLEVVCPEHPIARGVAPSFVLDQSERYEEPFDVPTPEAVVLRSTWSGARTGRALLTWQRGAGRLVYLSTGHEAYPIYHHPEVVKLVHNAIVWAGAKP